MRDLKRLALPHQTRQRPGDAPIAAGADVAVGEIESSAIGRYCQIGRQRHAHACPGHGTMQAGQDRLGHFREQADGLMHRRDQLVDRLHRCDTQGL
ncbi:hypothetical protein D3C85_1638270 [compost metagenome]